MEFRLLGAFEISDGDSEVRGLRRQERLLLAALLLKANELVSVAELVDLLWPDDPPSDARGAVQVYVSRLRKAGLGIRGTSAGYAVEVDPETVDIVRFRQLAEQARRTADPVERADGLRTALDLWRGQPLADLVSGDARERLCAGLEEELRTAEEDRIAADLAAGRHESLATELAGLVAASPLRERLVVAWMTALYRAGRKAEALAAYSELADRLAGEFGLDPAPAVRRLRLAILRDDPSLLQRASAQVRDDVPRELPVDISLLLGRDDLLAEGTAELTRTDLDRAPVYCLWGGAGVGKSAAGTRIGHLVAEAFPDGQLFARLQDVDGTAVPAGTLLGRMLRSLGVKPVPDSVEDRARLFQERTAERSILVVLDDALDVGEVEPLLPEGPRCAAIVTSRRPLRELTTASHRQVTPLDEATSRGLLTQLIGRTLRDNKATVDTVAGECAGLPLALRIVGSRLALSGDDALETLVGALADDEQRLDSLVAGDLAVRTSLDRTLTLADPDARRLFDCLSLIGVTEFPSWVAAPLLDRDEPAGVATFGRLIDLGLVEPVGHQQYKMHDLVRSYSAERLAHAGDGDAPRKRYLAAVHRLAALADKQLNHGLTLTAHLSVPDRPALPAAEQDLAGDPTSWFSRSWQLINAAAFAAVRTGEIELAGLLALHVNNYYLASEQLEPRIAVLEAARDALRVTGPFELAVRTEIAVTHAYHRPPLEMLREGERLLELANRSGSPDLQLRALLEMNHGARWSGATEEALGYCARALAIVDESGELELMRPVVLRHMASGYTDLHDYSKAVATLEKVLEISVPGTMSVGQDLSILGEIKLELGELDESEQLLRQAMANFRSVSSYYHLAWPTAVLARVAIRRGRVAEAAQLIAEVESWFEVEPWPVQVQLHPAKASLAFANGDFETGRQIIRAVVEKARARGDAQFEAAFQQHLTELEEYHHK
jgi:DNA-binding SARP family transcriptional activator/tetratricopeptide (TPR) repeat protein